MTWGTQVLLLYEGFRHPSNLQTLWLGICWLSSAAFECLSAMPSANHHLWELDLSLNDLGNWGTCLLCEGL